MKSFKISFALAIIAVLAGCAPVDSLSPLYTETDVVFDPALLGQWHEKAGEKGGWSFTKADDGGYVLLISDTDDNGQNINLMYEAHLVDLQGHRFLDLAPLQIYFPESNEWTLNLVRHKSGVTARPQLEHIGFSAYLELADGQSYADADSFQARLRLAHTFYKVEMDDDGKTLHLTHLDDEWVTKQIESGTLAIAHQMVGDENKTAVLTASTADLQQLVLEHFNDNLAFNGTSTIYRPGSEPELKTESKQE